MQSGELVVTGKDKVIIHLKKAPQEVKVRFKDTCHPVPCNPHHHDKLEWEILEPNHHRPHYTLEISWHVSGVREIVWTVHY